jgi:hypothetical protein
VEVEVEVTVEVILTFTAMWIDLEDTMLNKISQAQKENIA